jgi:uncharacterized protein
MSTAQPTQPAQPTKPLIEFPSEFPIKVAGSNVPELMPAVHHIAAQLDPTFDPSRTTTRASGQGNYLALTVTVTATSQAQLDELYRTLSTHPLVRWVL